MQKKQDKELVEHMLKMVGLEDFRKDYPHQLSGGMAQRVALVRSLINHPDILLLDEPLGALDAFTRMNMQDEILNIWREQKQTVVMVTHDVEEAIYMGTRVLVMEPRPGRVKACPLLKSGCVSEPTADARNLPGLRIIDPMEFVHPALPLNVMEG